MQVLAEGHRLLSAAQDAIAAWQQRQAEIAAALEAQQASQDDTEQADGPGVGALGQAQSPLSGRGSSLDEAQEVDE